jgi:hypothetical protein
MPRSTSGKGDPRGTLRRSVLLLWASLVACSPPPASRQEVSRAVDLPRHELIFARHSDAARQDYDLWRMCGDGTQLASLVVEPGNQVTLTVSPDGDAFAYSSGPRGERDIWPRSFGDPSAENLTAHPAEDVPPAWGTTAWAPSISGSCGRTGVSGRC